MQRLWRRNIKCKDYEVEVLMLYSRNKDKAIVNETEQAIQRKW